MSAQIESKAVTPGGAAAASASITSSVMAFSVMAAALGYFVDLYDIVIFGVVRVASLNSLGITGQANTDWGIFLLNLQMVGMLAGGFAWGIVGDKFGRRFALLATIFVFSAANLANAMITSIEQYAVLRFVAGFGLAGELGAGITLVSELLPENKRGYGTTIIAFLGLVGALTASFAGGYLDWRTAYLIGGALGMLVLLSRYIGLAESEIFEQARETRKAAPGRSGDWRLLFTRGNLFVRFLAVTAVGVPIWYVSALFVNLSPEYGKALGFSEPLKVADVLRWQALGLALGSAGSGLLSEWVRSRKLVLWLCLVALCAGGVGLMRLDTARAYLTLMFFIGLAQGYWTAFVTLSAEQFGTNVRATVSTAVPNIVRATTVPVTMSLMALLPALGMVQATLAIGAVVFGLAFAALIALRETYGRDLNYSER